MILQTVSDVKAFMVIFLYFLVIFCIINIIVTYDLAADDDKGVSKMTFVWEVLAMYELSIGEFDTEGFEWG
jgi:hypothetical protein